MRQLLLLVVVGWLPGAVLLRLPVKDRERRAALDPEERLFWTVILSLAYSLAVTLALAAFGRYSFNRLLIANIGLALAAAAIFRSRLRLRPPRHFALSAVIPIALALLAFTRFSPPAEYVMGGKDPGVYVNEGIQIAQRGSLFIRDATVAATPAFARDLFFPRHTFEDGTPRPDYYGIRFMGFRVNDPATGEVVGQFPHLFPASIAIAHGIHGLTGARWTTPFWAVLGVLAVYFVAVRLFGRPVGAVTGALLALNVVEVWFGKYPNAEVVMQALLFAALLAVARAQIDGDEFFAPVAGAILGLLLFLRLDVLLAIGAIGAGVLFATIRERRRSTVMMAATFGVVATLAAIYQLGPMQAYSYNYVDFARNLRWWHLGSLGLLLAVCAAALAAARSRPTARDRLIQTLPLLLALVLCAAGAYALLLRHPGGRLAEHDAYALRVFANFYVTVPAVIAALGGYALYARRLFWRDPALFVMVAVFCLFTFYKIRIVPDHFWAARRFVPVALPAVLLFAAALAVGPGGAGWRSRLRPLLGIILVLMLGAQYVRAARPVVDHVEYEGLIPKIEQLASRFGEDDLVIVEGRDSQSDVHVVGLPLAYIYARQVLELKSARPDKATFAVFVDWARTRYARVFFIGGGGTDLLSNRYSLRPVASERFQVPEFESTTNAFPRGVRHKEFEYGVYEFAAAAPPPGPEVWFDLDIGTNDDLHVLRFHAKEVSDGQTFRWTRARSFVSVTTIHPTSREVTLVLGDGGRPAAAPPARVEVFLHNQQIGSVQVHGAFSPYTLAIPPELAARAAATQEPVELRLVTSTWSPAVTLGSPDTRELGVMLDKVTIR